ncbi:MAG: plasmid partitioning/stability family protein [Coxiella endosymbiont of Dermacentor nuttalli]
MKDRRKVQSYLRPDIYRQDDEACNFIDKLPLKMRGEFIRQAVVCGVALAEVDTRLPAIISSLYRQGITGEELIALIKQVASVFERTTNEKQDQELILIKDNQVGNKIIDNLKGMKS